MALQAADFTAMPLDYLNNYVKRTPELLRSENGSREDVLVPKEAKKYFWLTRLTVTNKLSMPSDRGFYCAITTQGEGKLVGPFDEKSIKRGISVFIPASLPPYEVVNTGDKPLEVVCCYPPEIAD